MSQMSLLCCMADRDTAYRLQGALLDNDRSSDIRLYIADERMGGAEDDSWRLVFEGLKVSDTILLLISNEMLVSSVGMSFIGAARALSVLRDIVFFPILIGDVTRPQVIQDVVCSKIEKRDAVDFRPIAHSINRAILNRLRHVRGGYPPLFISHRHKDKGIAAALARLIQGTFDIEKQQIRCTSVAPYKLPAGERTSDRLRAEIVRARAVLGIISPDTAESGYVLFELGASWGQTTMTFPLLARGATPAHVPSPISDRQAIQLIDCDDCCQLLEDLEEVTGFRRRKVDPEEIDKLVQDLVSEARCTPQSMTGLPRV